MSLANTAYFANGFAVGGMMDTSLCANYVSIETHEYVKKERDKLRRRNAELEGMYKCACSEADSVLKDLRKCEAKNAELERELADIKESYRNVMAEPCESDDRVHCTCVPALRAENERLRKAINFIVKEWKAGTYSHEWFLKQEEVKAALKEVDGDL